MKTSYLDQKQLVVQQLKSRKNDLHKKSRELETQQLQLGYARLSLINQVYPLKSQQSNSDFMECYFTKQERVLYSTKNRLILNKDKTSVSMRNGGLFLDERQQEVFKIFEKKEKIHFIFRSEIDINIKPIYSCINKEYREDKHQYYAILSEYHIPEDIIQRDTPIQTKKQFKFTFLNLTSQFQLDKNTNVPIVLKRQMTLYLVFRELILDGIDYLHSQQVGHQVIYRHLKIDSIFSDSIKLPSNIYREDLFRTVNNDSDVSIDLQRIRQIEKRIKTQILRNKRQPKASKGSEHLYNGDLNYLRTLKITPLNNKTTIKQHLSQLKQDIPAQSKEPILDKLLKAEHFLKQKGSQDQYHVCWLEMRGFYLIWYHTKKSKKQRNMGLLTDQLIDDEGLIDDKRVYHIKLQDRTLTIKLERPLVGQLWRKVIPNQIAYKSFANHLWFIAKMGQTVRISSALVDYFFNEHKNKLVLENDAIQLKFVLMMDYRVKIAEIIFESILLHSRLKEIHLRGSHIGPHAISSLLLFLQEKRVHVKLCLLDLSACEITDVTPIARYLMNESSFQINYLFLDDNHLKSIEPLSQAIQERYQRFWNNPDIDEMNVNLRKRKQYAKGRTITEKTELELLRSLSLRNIQIKDFSSLFQGISTMIAIASEFLKIQLPNIEETLLLQKQNIQRTIKEISQNIGYNKKNLQLIRELYYYQEFQYQELLSIIRMDLDLSGNPIDELTSLSQLIANYDCLRVLKLENIPAQEQFSQLINSISNSLNLETLDLKGNRLTYLELQCILDALSMNSSIQNLTITYDQLFHDNKYDDVNNAQLYVLKAT